jgi:hypothetical protein
MRPCVNWRGVGGICLMAFRPMDKIAYRAGRPNITNVEWRIAAKQWLLKKNLINNEKTENVSPHLNRKWCHN